MEYKDYTGYFKALSDENRLKIIDMLSCGEICACVILEKFAITQSTLSHHMKILCDCSLVNARRDGKWTQYSLNKSTIKDLKSFLNIVTTKKDECICKNTDKCSCENDKGCCE